MQTLGDLTLHMLPTVRAVEVGGYVREALMRRPAII